MLCLVTENVGAVNPGAILHLLFCLQRVHTELACTLPDVWLMVLQDHSRPLLTGSESDVCTQSMHQPTHSY